MSWKTIQFTAVKRNQNFGPEVARHSWMRLSARHYDISI